MDVRYISRRNILRQKDPFNLHTLEIKTFEVETFQDDIVPRFLSKLHTIVTDLTEPTYVTYPGSYAEDWVLGTSTSQPRPTNTIWDSLLRHSVALRRLTVESQSESLLKYLISCPEPLEKIDIGIQNYACSGFCHCSMASTEQQCEAEHATVVRFMTTFWRRAIPVHKSALRTLSIRPPSGHCVSISGGQADRDFARDLNKFDPWGLTDDAKLALKSCQHLKNLCMGANNLLAFKDAMEFILGRISSVKKFEYIMGWFPAWVKMRWVRQGDPEFQAAAAVEKFRKEILEVRWNKRLTEARWGEVKIGLVPLKDGSWRVERDEEEDPSSGSWKLVFKERDRLRY
ncbi:hypothetical protein TWF506_007611 [Arthrobotrys conoides]|uniref:Uncharacterized protein n=1 Tax=Arthrobotrys conoides TaxID=74498 RepID=A0AAN8NY74_9PEZI